MKKGGLYLLFLILIVNLCLAHVTFAKEQLAVMDLKAKHGVKKSLAEALSVEIRDEIHSHGEYEVLSKEDLETIADRTALRQSLGCDDTKCLIDFGRAIGTKYMVAGSICKYGNTYSINLRLINTEGTDAGVNNRVGKKCKCSEDELPNTAKAVAALVMGKKETQVDSSVKTVAIRKKIAMGRLFVETEPKDARVRILNIVSEFYQGMELAHGRYHVQVSASWHETRKQWVDLGAGEDKYIDIRLVKLAKERIPYGKLFPRSENMGILFHQKEIFSPLILKHDYSYAVGLKPGPFTIRIPCNNPEKCKVRIAAKLTNDLYDNPSTILSKSEKQLIDIIGTGFATKHGIINYLVLANEDGVNYFPLERFSKLNSDYVEIHINKVKFRKTDLNLLTQIDHLYLTVIIDKNENNFIDHGEVENFYLYLK